VPRPALSAACFMDRDEVSGPDPLGYYDRSVMNIKGGWRGRGRRPWIHPTYVYVGGMGRATATARF